MQRRDRGAASSCLRSGHRRQARIGAFPNAQLGTRKRVRLRARRQVVHVDVTRRPFARSPNHAFTSLNAFSATNPCPVLSTTFNRTFLPAAQSPATYWNVVVGRTSVSSLPCAMKIGTLMAVVLGVFSRSHDAHGSTTDGSPAR